MENSAKSLHPLILIAAGSVTVASLAAVAYFTGLLPTRNAEPAAVVASAPATSAPAVPTPIMTPAPAQPTVQPAPAAPAVEPEASRPAPRHHVQRHASAPATHPARSDDWRYDGSNRRVANNDAGIDVIPSQPAPAPAAAPPVCHECGTVESVREVAAEGQGTGLGAIAGGVLGGVLGHQVGRGSGKDLATIAGAVGGAFAGHEVEKNVRSNKKYEVSVRFDDGSVRTYTVPNASWHTGDRVRLANGTLGPL